MPEISPSRYRVDATWNDVPHLTEDAKRELLAGYPPHMRDARSAGIPTLGIGAIYTTPWEELVVDPFPVPEWWPRGYALDPGLNRAGALWGAWDRDTDVLYLRSEYYPDNALPLMHASAIKSRGEWQTGLIDPASRGRSPVDGQQLLEMYRSFGLHLVEANNAVEAGIWAVQQRMETGRLKVFSSLVNFRSELRRYHRAEKDIEGVKVVKIVKHNDHLMDSMRYMVMGFQKTFRVRPTEGKRRSTGLVGGADQRAGY